MIRAFLCLIAVLLAAPAMADELRPGTIELIQQDEANWSLAWKQSLSSPGPAPLIVPELPEGCAIVGEPIKRNAPLALLGSAQVQCSGDVAGGQIGMAGLLGNSDVLVRVQPLDRPVQTLRLSAAEPSATIAAKPSAAQVWRSYFGIGVEHILMGWDHLLFVIALVLLVARPWAVIKAATAFTVAHSLTLAATVLGFVGMAQRPVEAVIALSIVFLAVELARQAKSEKPSLTERWPWLVAFLFGLIHGFGFAGALRDIGLPEGEVPAALISFNLGVEAGQLIVIAAVLAVRFALKKWVPAAEAPALKLTTYGIGIIGAYWLVDRLAGW
ncbi:HupE/UreJ family protein [Altererythrobacter sp. ZODW24]|uniref:HupE/UreJ family protein n=1 Tax=Altererythrobacter sp. ZODW24 TaxID=2185142 RepID=UPI000DF84B71|nr:HupE/UreJ family protein [Altererythrobacter sp. ZODW24]